MGANIYFNTNSHANAYKLLCAICLPNRLTLYKVIFMENFIKFYFETLKLSNINNLI